MPPDATSAGDGLDELQAARLSRQNRRPPTPKRPQSPGETPSAVGEGTTSDAPRVEEPPVSAPTPDATAPSVAAPVVARKAATPSGKGKAVAEPAQVDDGPLTLVQVRVTESQLDYLDEIEAVAATRRLDVTDAAVIRLALRQLMAAHSPEQIVERLGQPKVRGRRGRPRH